MNFHIYSEDDLNLYSLLDKRLRSSESFKHNKTDVKDFTTTRKGGESTPEDKEVGILTSRGGAPVIPQGDKVFGYSSLMDGACANKDFAILQAAKLRLVLFPQYTTRNIKRLVFMATNNGVVKTPMEMVNHRGLLPNVKLPMYEGLTLSPASAGKEYSFTDKLSELLKVWNYTGFVFLAVEEGTTEDFILSMSPYGPMGFWACFERAYKGNLAKLLWKSFTGRRPLTQLEIEPTMTLKMSIPPYPYTSCPWVPDRARASVEGWMNKGAEGIPIPELEEDASTSVVWYNVVDNKTTGAEVGFVSGHSYDDIETRINTISIPNLQYKRDREVMEWPLQHEVR